MCSRYLVQKKLVANEFAAKIAIYDEVRFLLDPAELSMLADDLHYLEERDQAFIRALHLPGYSLQNVELRFLQQVHHDLALRALKLDQGIRGILIEEVPNVNRSELTRAYLEALGFQPADLTGEEKETDQFYYPLALTRINKMVEVSNQVFHRGGVLFIKGLNTLPVEKFLNHLLMGKSSTGEKPRRLGFFVVAFQKPLSSNGAQPISEALQNRFDFVR